MMYSALFKKKAVSGGSKTIIFPFIGSTIGGSHLSAFTLAEAVQARSDHRCLIVAAEGTPIANEALNRDLPVQFTSELVSKRHRHWLWYDVSESPRRLNFLRSFSAGSIVHCNDIGALQSWGPAAKIAGHHVLYHSRSLHKNILFNNLLFRLTRRIVCISDVTRRQFDRYPSGQIYQITNPIYVNAEIDRKAARDALLEEFGFPNDAKLVGFVGNFWKRKRARYFLEVAKILSEREPCCRFVLFGRDGEETATEIEAAAESLGLGPVTRFAGFRLPAEENLAALDLVLFPAVSEPFGRALIEAMILGTPFVATDDAGHSEIVGRFGGGLLAARDAYPAEFAEIALAALLTPELASLSTCERSSLAEEVSPRGHAGHMLKIYESL